MTSRCMNNSWLRTNQPPLEQVLRIGLEIVGNPLSCKTWRMMKMKMVWTFKMTLKLKKRS